VSEVVTAAIVVAGGSGERFGRTEGKQLAEVAGRPVVSWCLSALESCGLSSIVLVCDPERIDEFRDRAVDPLNLATPVAYAASGRTRQESVASGLALVPSDTEIVLVHDGARPLLLPETVTGALEMLEARPGIDGVVVGHPSVDTLKTVDGAHIVDTPDRSRMWAVQTPQVFRAGALRSAHESARRDGYLGTDDAALVERNGGAVMVFEGPRDNIKITVPEDHAFAEAVLVRREGRK
jgi:2-C-methyl-D-erythritol 4-phosphate cytidylyltransferase